MFIHLSTKARHVDCSSVQSTLDGSSGALPRPYPRDIGIERPEREASHQSQSSAVVECPLELYLHSSICMHSKVLS
jgi:hypothetical protein